MNVQEIDAKVASLTVRAGDTVIVMCDRALQAEQINRLGTYIESKLPQGVKALVLDGGMTVATLCADKGEGGLQSLQPFGS